MEEQFYLVWPLLLIFIIAPKNHLKLIVSLIVLAIGLRISYYCLSNNEMAERAFNLSFTLCSLDALGAGALLAYLKMFHTQWLSKILSYWFIPFILLVIFFIGVVMPEQTFFFTVINRAIFSAVGFFLIGNLAMKQDGFLAKIFSANWLQFIGRISYGMYLYHWIIYVLLSEWFLKAWRANFTGILKYNATIAAFLFFTLLTIVISALSFYIIEKPLLSLKSRFR